MCVFGGRYGVEELVADQGRDGEQRGRREEDRRGGGFCGAGGAGGVVVTGISVCDACEARLVDGTEVGGTEVTGIIRREVS